MTGRVLVEVAVEGPEGALAAAVGGADRIELAAALAEGGVTPSLGTLRATRRACRLPLFVLVRPRPGGFRYSGAELAVMLEDIAAARDAGADGIVAGAVDGDGEIDERAVTVLAARAAPLPVTFHRAFDLLRDPLAAADRLAALGVARVLSAGGRTTAHAGSEQLARLCHHAGSRLRVVAGGGVRAAHVGALVAATGVPEVHLSAARVVHDGSPRPPLSLAAAGGARDPWGHLHTDADEVAAVRAALAAR